MQLEKWTALIYKYIKEDKIGNKSKFEEITQDDFSKIKKDTKKLESFRDKVSGGGSFKDRTSNSFVKNNINGDNAINLYKELDLTINERKPFLEYNDNEKILAKNILIYNSLKICMLLNQSEYCYSDIQLFISIINTLKNDLSNNIDLLLSSDELFQKFYNFAIIARKQYGYGKFDDIINKLEQIILFEDDLLKKWTLKNNPQKKK